MLEDPSSHPLVKQVCDASKRLLARHVMKNKPLSASHVTSIVKKFAQPGALLTDLQAVLLIVLGFSGFLRWNDLAGLRVEHLSFYLTHLQIYLPKRKNDQFFAGQHIHIARSGLPTCPVSLAERFLARTQISDGPLFRVVSGQGAQQQMSSKALSYSQARQQLQTVFSLVGLDPSSYCLHSLRAGGATHSSFQGISDRLIFAHGGWRSERARNSYIRDNKSALLSVSKSLGI